MTTPAPVLARVLGPLAACALLVLAGCGGSGRTTSVNLGGSITGLTDSGLLLSNGVSSAAIAAKATSFTFASRVLIGSAYSVQISALPPTLICKVANGEGIARDTNDISNVQITCVPRNNLGGTITGLASDGLVLANGSDTIRPPANSQTFTFPGKIGQGFSYGVTVLAQPSSPKAQFCTVLNGVGLMQTTDTNSVQVNCQ
ncbi:MAG: hypothetical protein NVSMB6_01490 [Burkholderiaceae bacterium]